MGTDYVLALAGFVAALWLWRRARGPAGRWWACALAATGVAAVLGGTSHGYAPVLGKETHGLVWRLTYASAGVANFCMGYGIALAALPERARRPALALLLVRLVAVVAALVALAEFRYVLYDYAITLALLLALAAWRSARGRPGAVWVTAGVVVSAMGAAVQLARVGQGRAFNHNDLFHVLQAIGLGLYARGGRMLDP
jgi:uncharacterized protein DUF6962